VVASTDTRCALLRSPVIDIHGGAFMLGSSKIVNKDQIADCLSRGWIVVAPNHRLCPQVNLLEGPIQDCRDLLAWIQDGGLQNALVSAGKSEYLVDLDHVFAFGTSSGGTLALCLVSLS
jgi:acetyl esterase/lipase